MRLKAGRGTVAGHSGIGSGHILDAVEANESPWLSGFTLVIDYVVQSGLLGTSARDRLTATSLTLLAKGPTKAHEVRPISVREPMLNVALTVLNNRVVGPQAKLLAAPADLGALGRGKAAGPMVRAMLAGLMRDGINVRVGCST